MGLELVADEDLLQRATEWFEKIEACKKRNHPFEENIIVPYNPNLSSVHVECSGCKLIYSRPPTKEERDSYIELRKLEVNI